MKQLVTLWPSRGPLYERRTRKQIAMEVAELHGLSLEDLKAVTRVRRIAWPRQEAMTAMIEAGYPTTKAGGFFGLDHTTAMWAKRRVDERLALAQQERAA